MEEKEKSQLEAPVHSWLFDAFGGFFFCYNCKVEISKCLYELEKDDYPGMDPHDLMDKIVDVECE